MSLFHPLKEENQPRLENFSSSPLFDLFDPPADDQSRKRRRRIEGASNDVHLGCIREAPGEEASDMGLFIKEQEKLHQLTNENGERFERKKYVDCYNLGR